MLLNIKSFVLEKKVLVFGNILLKEDSLPLRIMPALQKKIPWWNFVVFDPNEQLEKEGKDLVILDTVLGIGKVTVFSEKDLEHLEMEKRYSAHDFDLGFSLRFLLKLGKIRSVKIIGVPSRYPEKKAVDEIARLLENLQIQSGD